MFEYEVFLNLIHFLQMAHGARHAAPVKRKLRCKAPRQAPGAVRINPNAPWLHQARQAAQ
jgi:hypothetical protein